MKRRLVQYVKHIFAFIYNLWNNYVVICLSKQGFYNFCVYIIYSQIYATQYYKFDLQCNNKKYICLCRSQDLKSSMIFVLIHGQENKFCNNLFQAPIKHLILRQTLLLFCVFSLIVTQRKISTNNKKNNKQIKILVCFLETR